MKRHYFKEVKEGACVLPVEVSQELVDKALKIEKRRMKLYRLKSKLEAEIKKIEESCDHSVMYDTPGWPYDIRTCVACGHSSFI